MTTSTATQLAAVRHPQLVVVVVHAVLATMLFALTVIGLGFFPVEHPVIGAAATASLFGCQLSLALTRADHRRPVVLFAAVLLLSLGLLPVLGEAWLASLWFAGAAAGLVLPWRTAVVVGSAFLALWLIWRAYYFADTDVSIAWHVVGVSFVAIIGPFGAAALYSVARLPELVHQLQAAQAAAADQAAERERRSVARDLHDLFGQSLSAITLKSGLAERLLTHDRSEAARQVEDLEQLAAELVTDAMSVGEWHAQLVVESERARVLLEAAGITTTVVLDATPATPAADALFGWTVREAATNILRHSRATRCTIATVDREGSLVLEIHNDGVCTETPTPDTAGSGLLGLTARARTIDGSVDAGPLGDESFRLRVKLPAADS